MNHTMINYPLTIYFDGSCELCDSEMRLLKSRDVFGYLNLVDCSPAHFDATAMPYSRREMMEAITAKDAEGVWLRGVDAFIAIYRAAGLIWVSRLLATPGLNYVATRTYPWIVRNRYRLRMLGARRMMNWLFERTSRNAVGR
jgi:predicted DCC family thiol-disulfide oxidoreductase YuxK